MLVFLLRIYLCYFYGVILSACTDTCSIYMPGVLDPLDLEVQNCHVGAEN